MADAQILPFPDATFDRVTSRLAAMYFADCPLAFREARRVLRPGGRAVYLVWGPFEQPMFRDIVGVLFKYVAPPEDEPGAPSPFRFSEPGTLAQSLRDGGFVDVREESATVATTLPGDPARWWRRGSHSNIQQRYSKELRERSAGSASPHVTTSPWLRTELNSTATLRGAGSS